MTKSIKFEQPGTFQASRAAEAWLRARGFSWGSSQVCAPQAVWHGDCAISKWRNLSPRERADAHGIIEGDVREGPVTIYLRPGAPPEAQAAFDLTDEQLEAK